MTDMIGPPYTEAQLNHIEKVPDDPHATERELRQYLRCMVRDVRFYRSEIAKLREVIDRQHILLEKYENMLS